MVSVLLAVLFAVGVWVTQRKPAELEFLRSLTSRHLDGSPLKRDLRQKIIVVNFWASWCEPCAREFPSLLKAVHQLENEVVLLLISQDSQKEDVKNFLKAFDGGGANVEILWDPKGDDAKTFGTYRLPETYIFDRNMKFKKKVSGAINWSEKDILESPSS